MTATYRFLPWMRRGIAVAIADVDTLGASVPGRAHLPVELRVDGRAEARPDVALYGPGDVVGLEERQVVHTDPAAHSVGAETTRFPAVEFRSPTLPWLFTPAVADGRGRLRPWLCLVVLPAELAAGPAPQLSGRSPVVTLPTGELPDLAESWAWAHAQVMTDDAEASIVELLAEEPDRAVSRLLCPRRLLPDTAYRAFVVPAFEAGRKAGLGLDVTTLDEAELAPAWTGTGPELITLPVYYHWVFETGDGGDFASLAAELGYRPAPEGLGVKDVDIGELVTDAVLPFPGALRATRPGDDHRDDGQSLEAARAVLRAELERALVDDENGPVVGPPLYGGWQAAENELPVAEEPPRWLGELNVDPRHRAAAALGALVVRDQQHQLMASAWAQVGDVEEASQALRQAQLARESGRGAHRRLATLPAGAVLGVTHGVQRRVLWTEGTAWARLRSTPLPAAATSPTLRRLARPRGLLARHAATGGQGVASAAAADLLERKLFALPALDNPRSLDAPDNVLSPGPVRQQVRERTVLTDDLEEALADSAARLRQSLDFVESFPPRSADVGEIARGLLSRLDPEHTVPARVRDRVAERSSPREDGKDPLEPIMAAPRFPQPMYAPLRDLGLDAFAPGIDRLPADSVTLLETNPAFVEAFMVGLNHEMARELRWRSYPTDQRGTYFPSFWGGSWPWRGHRWEIHQWDPEQGLGGNHPEAAGDEGLLVLVLRGELLRRYPDAAVYAAKAAVVDGDRVPGIPEREPRFEGRAGPDVTFAGFDLTAQEARSSNDDGWFFVIEQPAGEPGFGIDLSTEPGDLMDWGELAWGHLREDGDSTLPTYAPIAGPLEGVRLDDEGPEWGHNAAHLARITLRRPVRVAIHADQLLPPAEEGR